MIAESVHQKEIAVYADKSLRRRILLHGKTSLQIFSSSKQKFIGVT